LLSTSLDKRFRAHYNAGVEEDRLLKGSSNLEFERTKRIILRYLPKRPSVIVDVGGGPGRYSFWLAEMGHSLHLIDVLPLHIRQARRIQRDTKHPLASIALGDARKLRFENASADAVLMFGPMYHLVREAERLKALTEARRVLRPNGLLFAAAISKFASVLDGSARGFIKDPGFMRIIRNDLKTGQHRNPTGHRDYFTTAFFHHPKELENEMRQAKFRSVKTYAVTGFAWLLPNFRQLWGDPKLKSRLMALLERTEQELSLLGLSDHLLAIGRK
jgi:ubiquinone/menaquinone biosynthesis C-methylase UbiE